MRPSEPATAASARRGGGGSRLAAEGGPGGAASAASGDYATEVRETLAEVPGLRVRRIGLATGQSVPWHLHTRIDDTFVGLRGRTVVTTREPDDRRELLPGDTFAVERGTPHLVTPGGTEGCLFLVIQGVGEYDYVALEE